MEKQDVEIHVVTCRSLNRGAKPYESPTTFQVIVQCTKDGATRVLCPKKGSLLDGDSICKAKSGVLQENLVDCYLAVDALSK